jgi:hypothetical protein
MEADQIIEASAYAIAADFIAMLPRIGMALCLLALTWLVIALANRGMQQVLKRTRMRRALAELVIEIADVGIWVVALFIAAAVAFPSVTPARGSQASIDRSSSIPRSSAKRAKSAIEASTMRFALETTQVRRRKRASQWRWREWSRSMPCVSSLPTNSRPCGISSA